MAAFAKHMVGSIAEELIKATGVDAVKETANLFFKFFEGEKEKPDETKEILKKHSAELQKLLTKIEGVGKQVDSLSKDIKTEFFQLKVTLNNEHVTKIETHYKRYMDALKGLSRQDPDKDPKVSRQDVIKQGNRSSNETNEALNQVHQFLVNSDNTKSLLVMANEAAREKIRENDLLSHYYIMSQFLQKYTLLQLQGIILLTCADKDRSVEFSGGKEAIEQIYENMRKQDDVMHHLIGRGAISVMAEIFRTQDHRATISMKSVHNGEFLVIPVSRDNNNNYGHDMHTSARFGVWSIGLMLEDGETLQSPDLSKHHKFEITSATRITGLTTDRGQFNQWLNLVDHPKNYQIYRFGFESGGEDRVQIKVLSGGNDNLEIHTHMGWRNSTNTSFAVEFAPLDTLKKFNDPKLLFSLDSFWRHGIGSSRLWPADEGLRPGMNIFSENGQYRLQFSRQPSDARPIMYTLEGRIQLIKNENDEVKWTMVSHKVDSPPLYGRLKINSNGRLVAYKPVNNGDAWGAGWHSDDAWPEAWETRSAQAADVGASLVVTDDGKVQVRNKDDKVLWSRGGIQDVGEDRDL